MGVRDRASVAPARFRVARIPALMLVLGAGAILGTSGCSLWTRPEPNAPKTSPELPLADAGSASNDVAVPEWVAVDAAACGVQARMPGEPKESAQDVPTDAGRARLTIFMFETPGREAAMGVLCSATPALKRTKAANDHILDSSRDGMVRQVRGQLVDEKSLTLAGYPARELVIQSDQKKVFARIVFERSKGRTVTLVSIGFPEEKAREFLDSAALK